MNTYSIENPIVRETGLTQSERQTLRDFMMQYEKWPSLDDISRQLSRKERERGKSEVAAGSR